MPTFLQKLSHEIYIGHGTSSIHMDAWETQQKSFIQPFHSNNTLATMCKHTETANKPACFISYIKFKDGFRFASSIFDIKQFGKLHWMVFYLL